MDDPSPASARFRSKPSPVQPIPLILLTGFLGSGKTTLLRRLLASPDWEDTAVLVNELGAVGLDQTLLWHAGGATVVLENGCICCSVRDDLAGVLEDLFWRRLQRQIPRFKRVVIETTGLADPRPVIDALLSHPFLSERYALRSVWCTVDGVLGAEQLSRHAEPVVQAACADLLLLTKSDLAERQALAALEQRLRSVNPVAAVQRTAAGALEDRVLRRLAQSCKDFDGARQASLPLPALPEAPGTAAGFSFHQRISSHVIHFGRHWNLEAFEAALRAALSRHGDKVLRVKGIIHVHGESQPVAVQAVQQQVFPFERIAADPGHPGFLVCITAGMEASALAAHFRQ